MSLFRGVRLVVEETAGVPPNDPLARLVERCARGDGRALAEIYDTTSSRVFGLCLRILRDAPAAEEATLDAYTTLWNRASEYMPTKGSVFGWILTLARSRAIDALRTRRRGLGREESLAALAPLADTAADPEAARVEAERAEMVRSALEVLPAVQRAAIEAAYFGGLSYAEAARALGESEGTTKSRIRAGLASLRRVLSTTRQEWA